ncbi:DUF4340 domain-containing protein [bacterium]|nr:DUF4340 domain-containing protein [bacterium]
MNRKFQILILIFIVLGVAVYFRENSRKKKSAEKPAELGLLFPDFDSAEVVSMSFGSFGGSVQLEKEDEKWFVIDDGKKFPADMNAVDKVMETTREMKATQIISRNPAKHMTFQVNAAQETEISDNDGKQKPFTIGTMGTEVTLSGKDATEIAHFYIGKNGSVDFMSTYLRKAGQDEVLLVNGYLKMIYGKGSNSAWKDLLICELQPEEISEIRLGKGSDAIVIGQVINSEDKSLEPGKIWTMIKPDRGVLDSPMLQRITGMFRRFRAAEFADDGKTMAEYGFENPTGQITVKSFEGDERVFLFGNLTDEKSSKYFFKEDGQDQVYVVPKYRLETIQKSADEFFETK